MKPEFPRSEVAKSAVPERILLAAKHLFATGGFENTSTASIARQAQTSESQLIKYFGSKDGLLAAIFEDGWNHINQAFGTVDYLPSPGTKLQALVGLVLSKLEEDEALKQLFLLEGRRIRREGNLVIITHGFLHLIGLVDELLAEMRELGQLRTDLSIEAIRSALIGMMEGLLRDRMLGQRGGYPAAFDSNDIRKVFLHVLQSFTSSAMETKAAGS